MLVQVVGAASFANVLWPMERLLQRLREAFPARWSRELTAAALQELVPLLEASAREYAGALSSVERTLATRSMWRSS